MMEDPELRQRLSKGDNIARNGDLSLNFSHSSTVAKDDTPQYMKEVLKNLSPRWRNWWIRTWFTVLMIAGFVCLVCIGTYGFLLTMAMIQVKCFHEIISIGYQVYKSYDLPWFRSLSWYFLVCVNYFFYGEALAGYFGALIQKEESLIFLVRYHRMIAYSLYLLGLILFVLSLVKSHYRFQFFMFGWTHVTLLIIVTQLNLAVQNLMEGIIWLVLPLSIVVCNDIMAYICGFFFGRTPLIKLSPKKTWEGFIGGGLFTVAFGWFFSAFLCKFPSFTCPAVISSNLMFSNNCQPTYIFKPEIFDIPQAFLMIGLKSKTVILYPFQLHSLVISVFASIIAPFGGFFASGFKRAFQIKDFGDTIPGHGGLMDRFDCQYLMATFVNVYLHTFIKIPSPHSVFPLILTMSADDQLKLYNDLKHYLSEKVREVYDDVYLDDEALLIQ